MMDCEDDRTRRSTRERWLVCVEISMDRWPSMDLDDEIVAGRQEMISCNQEAEQEQWHAASRLNGAYLSDSDNPR